MATFAPAATASSAPAASPSATTFATAIRAVPTSGSVSAEVRSRCALFGAVADVIADEALFRPARLIGASAWLESSTLGPAVLICASTLIETATLVGAVRLSTSTLVLTDVCVHPAALLSACALILPALAA